MDKLWLYLALAGLVLTVAALVGACLKRTGREQRLAQEIERFLRDGTSLSYSVCDDRFARLHNDVCDLMSQCVAERDNRRPAAQGLGQRCFRIGHREGRDPGCTEPEHEGHDHPVKREHTRQDGFAQQHYTGNQHGQQIQGMDHGFIQLSQNSRDQKDQGGQQNRRGGKPEAARGFFLHYSLQSSFQRSARFRRGSCCGG